MTNTTAGVPGHDYPRYPREIAATVTLGAAARALARPPGRQITDGEGVAITTACTALMTRLALVADIGRPAGAPSRVGLVTWELPDALSGVGPDPSSVTLRVAGERCVAAWRRWVVADGSAGDDPIGVAGALAVAAWCSWGTRHAAEARIRARYALDLDATDPLARLVLRSCRAKRGPRWTPVEP